jgi:hypothetical protein
LAIDYDMPLSIGVEVAAIDEEPRLYRRSEELLTGAAHAV